MKSIILGLFVIAVLIVILIPDESDGLPARFRGRSQRLVRRGRGGSTFRRGSTLFRGRNRSRSRRGRNRSRSRSGRSRSGFKSRRGRTFAAQDVLPPQEVDSAVNESLQVDPVVDDSLQTDYDGSGDYEESQSADVPHWCDPSHGMGSWLNFSKLRKWCSNNGYARFGPYGGVPVDASGDINGEEDRSIDLNAIDDSNANYDYEY